MSPRSRVLLGIDLGTSGLKCVLVELSGQVLGYAFREYAHLSPQPGWAEQDPETWLQAAQEAVRELVNRSGMGRTEIAAIGFSGQMHSTVFLDKAGRSLRPAILWLDHRSARQVERLQERVTKTQLAEWVGNPVMPGFMLSSLLWLMETQPATWERVSQVCLAKDYVRYRLTGELGTDYSDASSTALLDVKRREWCRGLLDATSIPTAILPPLYESSALVGRLAGQMADAMQLSAGLPVICGAGDQEAQAIGNGLIRPGLVSCTIGTGGQLFTPIEHYQIDPQLRMHTFCHAVPGLWHWEAATLSAGLSLRWLRDEVLAGQYTYQEMADAAMSVNPGADGLLFLPYLEGERTPHMDPAAKGVFCGLTLRHSWKYLVRAVMEGVVFSLRDCLNLMQAMGLSVERVVASGGGSRHPLWLQLQADILGVDVIKSESEEAAALGAALLAGIGVGEFANYDEACQALVRYSDQTVHPRPALMGRYRGQAELYRKLYPSLAEIFNQQAILI